MIIQSSNIGMTGSRSYRSMGAGYQSLNLWGAGGSMNATNMTTTFTREESTSGELAGGGSSFSNSMQDLVDRFNNAQSVTSTKINNSISSIRNMHQQIFDYVLYWLFGEDFPSKDMSGSYSANSGNYLYQGSSTSGMTGFGSMGGSYSSMSYFSEEETTSFSTTGTVVTADGRSIDFNMDVYMSRAFTSYAQKNLNFGAPRMTDPLVINLDSPIADVSDQKFYFDLDADGHEEYISMLNAGSGFLALDKNGDGKINDGSELFGTTSGDGFADLAKYDSDGNGWIDENDPIFDSLMIWRKNPDGTDSLCGIGQAGVGAIYLGSSDTQFSLTAGYDNHTNAQIRKTGMFLYENGNVGTVQHLDLAQ